MAYYDTNTTMLIEIAWPPRNNGDNIPAEPNDVVSNRETSRCSPPLKSCRWIQRGRVVVPELPSGTDREKLLRASETPEDIQCHVYVVLQNTVTVWNIQSKHSTINFTKIFNQLWMYHTVDQYWHLPSSSLIITVPSRSVGVSGLLRVIMNVSSPSTIVSSLTDKGAHNGLSLFDWNVLDTEIGAKSSLDPAR